MAQKNSPLSHPSDKSLQLFVEHVWFFHVDEVTTSGLFCIVMMRTERLHLDKLRCDSTLKTCGYSGNRRHTHPQSHGADDVLHLTPG